jgi:hypothetical protein
MSQAPRDENRIPTLLGVDSTLFETPTTVAVNSTTHELLTSSTSTSKYSTNAIDDYTTASTTYICKESSSTANWWFVKIDETGNFPLFTHATVLNNPTMTTYALAYANRTSLTYQNYNLAF